MPKKLTLEEFINRAKKIHNDNYDYSKVNYINNHTKVCIICPEHGEFWQTPLHHINRKQGCPICSHHQKITKQELIERANKLYDKKYDLSQIDNFSNNKDYITVFCHEKDKYGKEHGQFLTRIDKFLQGTSCPKCGGTKLKTREEFIHDAIEKHHDNYNYDKVKYIGNDIKILIKCNNCGKFFYQRPHDHLNGEGCPFCKHYKLEYEVMKKLDEMGIKYIHQFSFPDFLKRKYDICIPKLKYIIECQGEQHFKPTSFGKTDNDIYNKFKKQIDRDNEIYNIAINKNYNVIYYTNTFSFRNKENLKLNKDFYKDKKLFNNLKKLLIFIKNKYNKE